MSGLKKIWLDGVYSKNPVFEWVKGYHKDTQGIILEVVEKTGKEFNVVKKRWVVERTFSSLINYRRYSKDNEVLTRNSEAMIHIAMLHILAKRMA
ncbi:transposase [Zooshikella marina]|uniref:transposase n=1 Tax=Zooshikella ganghwensis TaxID=202772 RepID=UPI001BB09FE0|nr:transposase [Zooshikella ganghwensis]MBU2709125.1 transposase [Zooshikella ganghwensis]